MYRFAFVPLKEHFLTKSMKRIFFNMGKGTYVNQNQPAASQVVKTLSSWVYSLQSPFLYYVALPLVDVYHNYLGLHEKQQV